MNLRSNEVATSKFFRVQLNPVFCNETVRAVVIRIAMSERWDLSKILQFIRLYQENECLWNTKSIFYKKKTARNKAYQRIIEGMRDSGLTEAILQNKIRSLRNTYLYEFKKVKESKRLGPPSLVYIPKLAWYDKMNFLANYIDEKDSTSPERVGPGSPSSVVEIDLQNDPFESMEDVISEVYVKDECVGSDDDDEEDKLQNHLEQQEDLDSADNISENDYQVSIIEEVPPKKRRLEVDTPLIPKKSENNHDSFNSHIDGDEFYYFGLSIAAQLKKMPLENALQMQMRIQNLLTNERCEILRNLTYDHTYTQHFNTPSVLENVSDHVAMANGTLSNSNDCNLSNIQRDKKQMSNLQNNHIIRSLHTIAENQSRIQQQLQKVESSCDQSHSQILEQMLKQNLMMSKKSLKTLKKLFGEGLSPMEEEMGSYFPLSNFTEIDELENKIKNKENEDALKTYIISKKGNQNLDILFRNLITDEVMDAFNWDGRSGKRSLKTLRLFNVVLNDIFCHLGRKDYETEVRKFVELSHNRAKQKRLKQQMFKDQV